MFRVRSERLCADRRKGVQLRSHTIQAARANPGCTFHRHLTTENAPSYSHQSQVSFQSYIHLPVHFPSQSSPSFPLHLLFPHQRNAHLSTVLVEEGGHAGSLTGGELVHAGIVGVVHVVVDGVDTGGRAGIAANGAAGSSGSLGGGVGDGVATISPLAPYRHIPPPRTTVSLKEEWTYPVQPPWKVW